MLEQITSSDDSNLALQVLALTAVVYRPIGLGELPSLIDMHESLAANMDALQAVVGGCGSFLTIQETTIRFVHQSAKDFLLRETPGIIFPGGTQEVHRTIYSRSLDLLSSKLKRDIYSLQREDVKISKVQVPDPDPLGALDYACSNWIDHLCDWASATSDFQHDSSDLQDGGSVDKFLRGKYLYWLEALSLLKHVTEGMHSITKLERLVQVIGTA
jgi:hypothetical protein